MKKIIKNYVILVAVVSLGCCLTAMDDEVTRGWHTDANVQSIKDTVDTNLDAAVSLVASQSSVDLIAGYENRITGGTTISSSGTYFLATDISGAITISANNVMLNLNGHTTSAAINVGAFSNIMLRDGLVSGVTGTAVSIASGASQIILKNMCIVNNTQGLNISNADDILIQDCTIEDCASSPVCVCTDSDRITIRNVRINNSTVSSSLSAIDLDGCSQCLLDNIEISGNSGTSFIGIEITTNATTTTSEANVCRNILIDSNSSSSTTCTGIRLTTTNSAHTNRYNVFDTCKIINNSATTTMYGIQLTPTTGAADKMIGNVFSRCTIMRNSGSTTYGVELSGAIATNENHSNIFTDFLISRNAATSGSLYGFSIAGVSDCTLLRPIITYNTASSVAVGIEFVSGSGGNNWEVKESEIYRNAGSSAANSYGIRRNAGSNNAFIKNIAFSNGPSGASTNTNQFNGVPATSITTPSTVTNVNAIDLPWTNSALVV